MSPLSSRRHSKLLLQILLGLTPFLILGLILVGIFRWGEIMPFMVSLFVPDGFSYLSVALLGLSVGTIVVLISLGLIIKTNTELPQSGGAEMIKNHKDSKRYCC